MPRNQPRKSNRKTMAHEVIKYAVNSVEVAVQVSCVVLKSIAFQMCLTLEGYHHVKLSPFFPHSNCKIWEGMFF
ncbi:unnamed protein product [Larinioides sclopetarius]|uniref:Uncharacterized protein n=1 Tax=Larinioides sclopetarius TaxID=280406 RepID=A0AAV2AVZ1_9ARAC